MSSSFVKDCSDASAPVSSHGMSGSSASATGHSAGNKTVFIIVNNDTQIDQEQLSSLLASHAGASSEVSVLQMAGSGGSGMSDVTASGVAAGVAVSQQHAYQDTLHHIPLESGDGSSAGYSELALDAESLHQLESVLCTDEARQLLTADSLLDILSAAPATSGASSSTTISANNDSATVAAAASGSGRVAGRGKARAPPKRRSQRQQDKAEREEVTKILAENQRMLQREREELMAAVSSKSTDAQVIEPDRQQRETPNADGGHSEQEESDPEDSSSDDEEHEDDDDEDDKDEETGNDQAVKNSGVTQKVSKGAARGRGRPRKAQLLTTFGLGRGRGAHEPEGVSREAIKPGPIRGARGRGRGRPVGRGKKGKQMPVFTEEDEDDELPELGGPSGAPSASSATHEGGSAVPAA